MSIMDSMLLEGYRDPREVYIALRSDGLKGSGTIDDPYDGGTRMDASLSGTLTCDPTEFIVDVAGSLPGLLEGSTVKFQNVTGPAASWFNSTTFRVIEVLEEMNFVFGNQPPYPFRLLVKDNSTTPQAPLAPPAPPFTWNSPSNGQYQIVFNAGGLTVNATVRWPVAKVTTSSVHGLSQYAAIRISNISNTSFAGDYSAVVSTTSGQEAVLRYRLPFLPDATQLNALPLSCTLTPIRHRFDEVMRSIAPYSAIHVGPGTFETRGRCGAYLASYQSYLIVYVGVAMQSGQRVLGAGMGATVVKLVLPEDQVNAVSALGCPSYPPADYSEVADLTVDCNGPGQVAPYGLFPAPFTCGAIELQGSHIRIRRVRAINFCAQGPAECFGIFIHQWGTFSVNNPASNPASTGANCVIEECVTEKPGENNTHETTLIAIAGDAKSGVFPASPVVRHNYQNSEYSNGFSPQPVPLAALQRDGTDTTLAILTSSRPHTHVLGKALVVQGAKQGGVLSAFYNGIFTIEQIVSDTMLKYRLSADPGTGAVDVSGASIGWPISSEAIGVASLTVSNTGLNAGTATLTTKRPHNRLLGQNIRLEGVKTGTDPNPFFGTFKITRVNSSTEIEFYSGTYSGTIDVGQARIGVFFIGRGALSATGCVTEGNSVFNGFFGHYQDTGSTRDVVIRDNYYSNVSLGLNFDFNPLIPETPDPNNPAPGGMESVRSARTGVNISSLTRSGSIATAITESPHGLKAGEMVAISGAAENEYNGNLIAVTLDANDQKKFTYSVTGAPASPATGGPIRIGIYCLTQHASEHQIAILETAQAHHLKAGDVVKVSDALQNNGLIQFGESYNDIVAVLEVLSDTSFSYEMNTTPNYAPDPATSEIPIHFQSRYQVHQMICERNVFDLYPLDSTSAFPPSGLSTISYRYRQLYMFPNAVLRENSIRHLDSRPAVLLTVPTLPSYDWGSRALRAHSFDATLVDYNLMDVSDPHPVQYFQGRAVAGFANQAATGQSLPLQEDLQGGSVQGPFQNQDSMESKVQDALLLGLL